MTPEEFWKNTERVGKCLNWLGGRDTSGYGSANVDGVIDRTHRHAYRLRYGSIPEGKFVLHKCDNRLCVEPSCLYAGTKKNNAEDRERRGRGNHATGERHGCATHPGLHEGARNGRAKLNEEQVINLLREHKQGMSKAALARKYGVSDVTVCRIVSGKLWPNVER